MCGEYLNAAFCVTVTQMEPAPAQQVCHRGGETPTRGIAARMPPRACNGQCPVLSADVSDREAPGHDVITREETVRQRQWLEDERSNGLLERLARDFLDEASEQVVPRLAVGDPATKRSDQINF